MWIFLILVSVGLVFMLYALVHFFRDGRQRTAPRDDRSGSAPAKKTREGVVGIRPGHLTRKDSHRGRAAGWNHDNGEIQIRSINSDGHVVVRRIRAIQKHRGRGAERSRTGN